MNKGKSQNMVEKGHCITCGTELLGDYCYRCGEKRVHPAKDYSIIKFVEQVLDGITHLNSKFFKSFWLLLIKPGFLTSEYIKGRRAPYMKPIQLFIVAGLLFYFFFPAVFMFYSNVNNMETGYAHNNRMVNVARYDLESKVNQKAEARKATVAEIIYETHKEAAHKSKAMLFVLFPFLGAVVYLLFRNSINYYVPHIIFVIHSFTFFIIFQMGFIFSMITIGFNDDDMNMLYLAFGFLIYLFLAVRKTYESSWIVSFIKSLFVWISFIVLLLIYRQFITILALNSV